MHNAKRTRSKAFGTQNSLGQPINNKVTATCYPGPVTYLLGAGAILQKDFRFARFDLLASEADVTNKIAEEWVNSIPFSTSNVLSPSIVKQYSALTTVDSTGNLIRYLDDPTVVYLLAKRTLEVTKGKTFALIYAALSPLTPRTVVDIEVMIGAQNLEAVSCRFIEEALEYLCENQFAIPIVDLLLDPQETLHAALFEKETLDETAAQHDGVMSPGRRGTLDGTVGDDDDDDDDDAMDLEDTHRGRQENLPHPLLSLCPSYYYHAVDLSILSDCDESTERARLIINNPQLARFLRLVIQELRSHSDYCDALRYSSASIIRTGTSADHRLWPELLAEKQQRSTFLCELATQTVLWLYKRLYDQIAPLLRLLAGPLVRELRKASNAQACDPLHVECLGRRMIEIIDDDEMSRKAKKMRTLIFDAGVVNLALVDGNTDSVTS